MGNIIVNNVSNVSRSFIKRGRAGGKPYSTSEDELILNLINTNPNEGRVSIFTRHMHLFPSYRTPNGLSTRYTVLIKYNGDYSLARKNQEKQEKVESESELQEGQQSFKEIQMPTSVQSQYILLLEKEIEDLKGFIKNSWKGI